ncbi:MAG: Lrp/AsnC family transcriptional regulator [Mycobacteriales bacterium]
MTAAALPAPRCGTFVTRSRLPGISAVLKGLPVVQAYILIQTEVGKAASVAQRIAGLVGVTLAEDVTGPYDVIVRAEASDVNELGKLVVARVQGIDGITRTLTCPIVQF